MNSSACSAVICQPSGHEQKHDIMIQKGLLTVHLINIELDGANRTVSNLDLGLWELLPV